jgi:leucyl aminopeptidase
MQWKGGGDEAPLALIGKGVVFDTGGISLKPAGGMEDMTMDMGGAGTVAGAMKAIAGARPRPMSWASWGWWKTCPTAARSARATW